MNITKQLSTTAITTLFLQACGGDTNGTTKTQVKQHYVAMAHTVYNDSLSTAIALQQAVNTFTQTPTQANLLSARSAYKAARIPYQQSEIMRFDSGITANKNLADDGGLSSVDNWEGQVNAWPLDESHIISIIESSDEINKQLLLNQNGANDDEANVTTGVHAVEFMLWGTDTNGTDAGAGQRQASDFNIMDCPDSYCQRRVEYLTTAIDLLVDDLTVMTAEWSPTAIVTAGTLANNFTNSTTALDYILGSIHAMATDELAGARMNSGLLLGDPEEEHDCFSDLSHLAIYYNFQGVKNAFYGQYNDISGNTISGAGLGDYLKQFDVASFTRIDQALVSIDDKMFQLFAFGEREVNPIHFDQIIGQDSTQPERKIAEAAVAELFSLDADFKAVAELLALDAADTSGAGD
jgi:putative iron-regulated protein